MTRSSGRPYFAAQIVLAVLVAVILPGIAQAQWTLTWSEQAAQDFYLNNILIHELGHLVDDRNTGYMDRERFAEWFAVHYGYRHTGVQASRGYRRAVRKRHHK